MRNGKSILFLTTVNLSANPRLVKEIDLAIHNGYQVSVILFRLGNWGDENDLRLMAQYRIVRFMRLSALRRPFGMWLLSSILERVSRVLCRFSELPELHAMAIEKRYILLRRAVIHLNGNYDWVIAHNPAAFHPALLAARRFGARFGMDVEDYHPAETQLPHRAHSLRTVMKACLAEADYASYAAPLIREASDRDISIPRGTGFVVLNAFPKAEFPKPDSILTGPLRLVWFSQHIHVGRGLEMVLPVVSRYATTVELHLYGQLNRSFSDRHISGIPNVHLHGALPQHELHSRLGQYDIGLAVDVLSDANRDLVVTNKIMAYLQAGLYLAVTETRAQQLLLAEFPKHGSLFAPSEVHFSEQLEILIVAKEEIRQSRASRHEAALLMDWSTESSKLLQVWAAG